MRHCLMLDLRDDAALIAQYEAWAPARAAGGARAPAPPRRHGDAHLPAFGTRLCMVMTPKTHASIRRRWPRPRWPMRAWLPGSD